ncbi:MAG TPA: tetratricopeptide repeat protein [Candidatus Methylacidiphilales bacterium]|nr:tetratricopeptide repeat protein [Candidatus Methylacidiphilales bacterium]
MEGTSSLSSSYPQYLSLRIILILFAGFWIYAPALTGDWIWDDVALIPGDTSLHSLAGLGARWLSNPDWGLTSSALYLQWRLWGPFPFGYHLVNLLLHLGNGLLIWRLLSRLGLRWAWLGGLLFVIHPLAVESVAWISEFKNTFSLFFFLLSLLAWINQDEGKGGYLFSLFLFLAAMLGKTSVVMLPAILLLYAWWKHGRVTCRDCRKIIPYFVTALLLGLVSLHFQADYTLQGQALRARSLFTRLADAGMALFFYAGKFLWPFPLMPIYPRWPFDEPLWLRLLTLPLLAFIVAGLWMRREKWSRHALLGFGFFALNLLPVLGLIGMFYLIFSPVADHFVYLPMIGLIGLLVALLETAAQKLTQVPRLVLMVTIGLSFSFFTWQAHRYAGQFTGDEKLWAYTLRLNPTAWAAHNNLGFALLQSGRMSEAEKQFDAALRLNPLSADAHNNLGIVCLQTGRCAESMDEFKEALRLNPGLLSARVNLELARAKFSPAPKPDNR